jgi:glycosyltransferase involved in cell wall biosynthesis
VVQDGVSGRLVPARDPSALAAALIEALRQPERARAWSEQARLGVMQFDIERTVQRTMDEYRRVLEAHC